MSDKEVDKCARQPEELLHAQNRRLLEWLEDKELLGNWISNMEEIVKVVEDAYCNLENLRNALISLLGKLQVAEAHALHVLSESI